MKEKELKEENKNKEEITEKGSNSFFKKKEIWISGAIGLVIGILLVYLLGMFGLPGLGHETLVSFKGGKVTKNEVYEEMQSYGLTYALELADKSILDNMYELTDEQKQETEEEANSVLEMYQGYYGYTEQQFLEENGFDSKEDFIEYMEFDYKRNLACLDYFKTLIPAEEIESYYNENIKFGEIKTKHILVETSENVTEKQALATANEILAKLKEGKSFEDVATEYEDKATIENDVDFDSFTADTLASTYVEASKKLEKDTYTTKPVKTDYGYHIIYCVDKADTPSLEEATNDIVEILGADLETEDQYIRYKALIKLREDNKLKFKNKDLEEDYKEYCEQVNPTETTTTEE